MADFSIVGKIVGEVRRSEIKNGEIINIGIMERSKNYKALQSDDPKEKNDIFNVSVFCFGDRAQGIRRHLAPGNKIHIRHGDMFHDEYKGQKQVKLQTKIELIDPIWNDSNNGGNSAKPNSASTSSSSEPEKGVEDELDF